MLCLSLIVVGFSVQFTRASSVYADSLTTRKAFMFKPDDYAVASKINVCIRKQVQLGFETELNMPVCDDKLCANVWLKIYWDMAGNFTHFDTISGKPLTKFDHKRFTGADYLKLNQILKNRNSILRSLEKSELVDPNVRLKATTVDAVTGATPASIRNAVVEGAVYSSYALWHFVNGSVCDSLRSFSLKNYSRPMLFHMLESANFETQLFALKQFSKEDYEVNFERLVKVMLKSSPLIRAYIINKLPVPFQSRLKNEKLAALAVELDEYSTGIFINRIVSNKEIAEAFFPFIDSRIQLFNSKQQEIFILGIQKLGIRELEEKTKKYSERNEGKE